MSGNCNIYLNWTNKQMMRTLCPLFRTHLHALNSPNSLFLLTESAAVTYPQDTYFSDICLVIGKREKKRLFMISDLCLRGMAETSHVLGEMGPFLVCMYRDSTDGSSEPVIPKALKMTCYCFSFVMESLMDDAKMLSSVSL